MLNWLARTELLIGKDNINKLKDSTVAIFGCGGVGSYVAEGLVRSGVGNIVLIDSDMVDITNINRQLIADTTTIGMAKVEVAKKRLLNINPDLNINVFEEFYNSSTNDFLVKNYDYIVDAIDTVTSKILLVETAKSKNIPIISSMGTGNKLDPTRFEVSDISKTSVCPLAKVMRKELGIRGIKHLKVVYSKEIPNRFNKDESLKRTPASIAFVPSVAGPNYCRRSSKRFTWPNWGQSLIGKTEHLGTVPNWVKSEWERL